MKQRNVVVSILVVVLFGLILYFAINGFPDFKSMELTTWLNQPVSQLKVWEFVFVIFLLVVIFG